MKAQQHISSKVLNTSASSLWSDVVAMGDVIIGFTYNNEPKQNTFGMI